MNESKRTLIFVAAAVLSVGAAAAAHYASRPRQDAQYGRIGEEFYPEFKDPTEAQVLRVVTYDEALASVKPFMVEYRNGKWKIPSHHDYPADGKDRLAQTAASVIGTTRGALVTRLKSDHARYGVVDPESTDDAVLKGRGQKLTLSKNDGNVLAEFIIGKKVEGQTDVYYVRAPRTEDGDAVYLAKLKIDLSTKFADWIEPDLLKVDRDNLSDIRIDNYTIDQQQGAIIPGKVSELKKTGPADAWKFEGMNDAKEELKTDVVNQLVSSLDNLRIVGVRPKPPGIKPDLSLDPKYANSREMVLALWADMINKGFYIAKDQSGKTKLFSQEGELEAGTNEGVDYALHFGQIFTGTEFEVETGLSKDAKDKKKDKDKKETAKADDKAKDAKDKDDDKNKEGTKKSRYLMVSASFDQKLLGDRPKKPTEPVKPPGVVIDEPKPAADKATPAKTAAPKAGASKPAEKPAASSKPAPPAGGKTDLDQTNADGPVESLIDNPHASTVFVSADKPPKTPTPKAPAKEPAPPAAPSAHAADKKANAAKTAPSTNPAPVSKPADGKAAGKPGDAKPTGKPDAKPAPPPKPDPKAEYLKALDQYKKDLERYQNDNSEYDKKLKKGQEKVKELNDRFGPWYYVISAESFENLRLARETLVKPKEAGADKKGPAAPGLPPHFPGMPGLPGGGLPGGK